MNKKAGKRNPLQLHRDTLQSLELRQAVGGVTLKCPDTQTGIEKPICIC